MLFNLYDEQIVYDDGNNKEGGVRNKAKWHISAVMSLLVSIVGFYPGQALADNDVTGPVITAEPRFKWDNDLDIFGMNNSYNIVGESAVSSVEAEDDLSGVDGFEYYVGTDPGIGNGVWVEDPFFEQSLTVTTPGTYTFGVRAKDVAGNWGGRPIRHKCSYSMIHLWCTIV